MRDAPRRFPVAMTIATVLALALLVGLGGWQLKRLAWKQDLLARISALQAAPAQPIGPVLDRLAAGQDVGFTRTTLDCPGLASAPSLELYALRDGQAGSRLISACKTPGAKYRSILVDRGFLAETISARPGVKADDTPMRIIGILRAPDKPTFVTPPNKGGLTNRWYSRDIPAMAAALGVTAPAPVFLMAETSSNPEWKALVPAPVPTEIPNRHLEYALTWFGLAGALLAVYAAVLWRGRKT